jgi:acyl-CoA synthetase (AMP-forming)/AMP-acid ligase II
MLKYVSKIKKEVSMNLYEVLDFAADRFPGKEAIVWTEGKMTYQKLREDTNRKI